jgi:hypothetical protein
MLLRMHLQNIGLRVNSYWLRELRYDVRHGEYASQWLGRRRRYGEDSQVGSEDERSSRPESEAQSQLTE